MAVDRPTATFKPRRRSVSPARRAEIERWMTTLGLDEDGPPLDLPAVFGRRAPVLLEIGFGGGESTLALARERPDEDVLAVEVHTPGVSRLLAGLVADGLTNVRVVHGDALVFLRRVPTGSLAGVRILYPDPWPKQRQRHRRLLDADVVDALVERLEDGGQLHLATDSADYARQMRRVCETEPRLAGGEVERPGWRPVTRFEQRGRDDGRASVDLVYRRVR